MELIFSNQAKNFQPGIYQHYKGPKYEALRAVHHSETLGELVLYRALDDNSYWVRPLKMFLENVEIDGKVVPRFKLIKSDDK